MALAASVLGVTTDLIGVVARLMVCPDRRRMGVGRALLERAASEATERGLYPMLDVATHFQPAIDLYDRSGWLCAGKVTAVFRDATTLDEFVYLAPAALRPSRPA
jgi:GNAT superfamily N-acetyltransferase